MEDSSISGSGVFHLKKHHLSVDLLSFSGIRTIFNREKLGGIFSYKKLFDQYQLDVQLYEKLIGRKATGKKTNFK